MKLPFDQAARYYDQTRADPDWVMDALADAFLRVTQATNQTRILEVGIGTGRIAMNLLQRGLTILGVDLALAMMRELQKKIPRRGVHVSLAQADAETLPFPDDTFDVVYAVHVYHLIANWRTALLEARRVLKRRGAFLVNFHARDNLSPNRKIRDKLGELARARGIDTTRPGAKGTKEITSVLEKWGGKAETIEVARWSYGIAPARVLEEVEARIYSDTWQVPPEVMAELMPSLRAWARAEYGDLSREIETEGEFNWLVVGKF